MSGKRLVLGLLLVTALFAGALWYFQTRAWYEEVTGLSAIRAGGREIAVSDYLGIDAPSPQKLRACFRADPAAFTGLPPAPGATPLIAPGWFACFDAGALTADLAAGRAVAHLAAADDPKDFETIVAVYPDGRAFLWRQLNAKFRD